MSGGPALYYSKMGQLPVSPGSSVTVFQPLHILHGVSVGRIGDNQFEAQVGVVWKKEIIDSGVRGISTWQIECSLTEIDREIRESWPQEADPVSYLDEKPCLSFRVHHVMEALKGRCDPYLVRDKLKEFAAEKSEAAIGEEAKE
jgi:hypothetical protein